MGEAGQAVSRDGAGPRGSWRGPVLLACWIVVLGFFFAQVEIQIEGADGWAAGLPTWRVETHPLLDLFWGGRPLTGYHAWVFGFMALVFHLGLFLEGRFRLWRELRILGSLMVFWIVEDALWFLLNPAFGLQRLRPEHVPWHKHWLLGVPTDYVVFAGIGGILLFLSFRAERRRP